MSTLLSDLCITADDSIRHAIACIDRNEKGIVLVTDAEGHLTGTITDGDVRRALLGRYGLETPVKELLSRKASSLYAQPTTALRGTDNATLLQLMQEREVHQIPLVDEGDHVVGLVTLDDLLPNQVLPLQAVIMAGGYGTRLRPLTEELPKPMLPVGDRPLMELIISQLRRTGITRVNVATHYLPEKIKDYFGDGRDFGIELSYVTEDRPLGTAGALGLMETPENPVLIINGDILTRVNFKAMLEFHRENEAALTVAVRKYDVNVPYGVIESDGARVRALQEKPLLSFLVNAGIYLLEPSAHRYIPNDQHSNMTDLIERLINEGHKVVSFPIMEYWLDIGNNVDYERAQKDVKNGEMKIELDW
ncbi:MAG TPA: nucleotidyltransferase family protein [Pyrinomonadaceae bacterium]|nr:nucleotidyltransferase family protein [Pyrinomonadaceae bacterium]